MHCRLWCSALVVMAVVVWSLYASSVHCESYCSIESKSNFHSSHSSRPRSTQPQPSQTVQNTISGSAHSCSPDDGHNDARNMLRKNFDNKNQISCILLVFLSLRLTFLMHGHKSLKFVNVNLLYETGPPSLVFSSIFSSIFDLKLCL